ncbi:MAG TPA: hypothetical protein VL120_15525, partial [Solirubrobacteraceae bacterium]|nr:hypothetical protein [Solirubrobacteraceae bacterium]
MSHLGQQLSAPAEPAHEIEQVLLGLADGSYVLSTPDGAVAECGAGVVALLRAPAEALAGRRTADVLVAGADAESRAAFEALLHGDGDTTRSFAATTVAGMQRSLQFVVVAVPLALGWEFTSLLGELSSRDAGTWHPEALRLRHGRALEAIEGVCIGGSQPDPGARLAGLLIIVRDVDAPPLTREDVGRRMAEHREAARAAAAEAARRADAATGRAPLPGDPGYDGEGPGLEDLVERARILRERVEEAERDAVAAVAERDHAIAQIAGAHAETEGVRAELAATAAELAAAQEEIGLLQGRLTALQGELEGAHRELEVARGEELAGAVSERDGLRAELESARAELESTRAELEATVAAAEGARAEREQARQRASRLLSEAEAARAAADAIRAEFAFDDPPAPAPAPGTAAGARPAADPPLALPAGAPGEALALIGLDGAFKRLDDAFCSLLGYREEDLRSARWPSVIDRENYAS